MTLRVGGERDGWESSAFLTKTKFAADYQSGFIIRRGVKFSQIKVGRLGLRGRRMRTSEPTNENRAHLCSANRSCNEYFEVCCCFLSQSDLSVNDEDINTRSHLRILRLTNHSTVAMAPKKSKSDAQSIGAKVRTGSRLLQGFFR